uniref:Reverse transcriptase zinc-binding domain-containing protein n=1 Tax=Quercus lobata TaxID=97700 RepID=A0A7N2R900_QUELO
MAAMPNLRSGCCWRVGNGEAIRVRKDKWIPNYPSNKILHPVAEELAKLKVFCWRACHKILPTRVNLAKRKLISDDRRHCCKRVAETTIHAIWECRPEQDVWVTEAGAFPCSSVDYMEPKKRCGAWRTTEGIGLIIEGDSLNVIRALSNSAANSSLLSHIYDDIRCNLKGMQVMSFRYSTVSDGCFVLGFFMYQ